MDLVAAFCLLMKKSPIHFDLLGATEYIKLKTASKLVYKWTSIASTVQNQYPTYVTFPHLPYPPASFTFQ